jgi:hypothetical protein
MYHLPLRRNKEYPTLPYTCYGIIYLKFIFLYIFQN